LILHLDVPPPETEATVAQLKERLSKDEPRMLVALNAKLDCKPSAARNHDHRDAA